MTEVRTTRTTCTVRAALGIAEALFARGGAPPQADRLAWLERELADFLARCGARTRFILSFMIALVSLLAPLFVGKCARLASLPLPTRIAALTSLERHFGDPLLAVKALLCLLYYEHPDAARDVSFDAKCWLPSARPSSFPEHT